MINKNLEKLHEILYNCYWREKNTMNLKEKWEIALMIIATIEYIVRFVKWIIKKVRRSKER